MRAQSSGDGLDVRAIAGSHVVLLAMDADKATRTGLLGFAIKRTDDTESQSYWLRGQKVFQDVVPQPISGQTYSCLEHPFQSFLWGDYSAKPGRTYSFIIRPVYGTPKNLSYGKDLEIRITTEDEDVGSHAVYFNRGAIASRAFADKFGNQPPKDANDPQDPTTKWLSRGLLEAALGFIDGTLPGETLRVAAYEFSYAPILNALADAHKRGVDLAIVYEAGDETRKGKREPTQATEANAKAIKAARLPKKILRTRTRRNDIPHNKFMVRLSDDPSRVAVWTGSVNFTPSGFLGQSNVGHIVRDAAIAATYLNYWKQLADDAEWNALRAWTDTETPAPDGPPPMGSVTPLFSPRPNDRLLDWYAQRIAEAKQTVMFTAAFGVNATLAKVFAKDAAFLRYILLEKPLKGDAETLLSTDRDLQIANGAALGKLALRAKIPGWQLDKWFLDEGHYRYEGNVFYIHTKILLIDPLSDDPLVISGSANFSKNSLVNNDENMLLIRGDTRVADIYMTEFDRIFRHFYFRNIANKLALEGKEGQEPIFLDPTAAWVEPNFGPTRMKSKRRKLFFPTSPN
ncbi:phospholipase D-like domain-containing protein [Aquabacter cavernae]|uniref:phospholipase D-like domain-containing protein n=1 Tax=Aquabacter cavernae TaxID=2496029 RepID=UPI0013DF0DE9|nr:phospholipase D-like domain-containing protein [Aquabacter cavernae]